MTTTFAASHGSAAQRIENELRRLIIALELPPGSRLSEQDIAERHGVSRQPVREALIGLARTRLVEIQPQRGTTVVKISVRKMMEARFVREAIETAVVRRACASFDQQSRERINDLLEMQEQAARRDDHDAFQRYDELFHIALAEGAGCPLAWEAVQDIKAHMDRVCQLTLPNPEAMLPLIDQHRAIIAAIDARDEDAAAEAMRHHLTEILRTLPRVEAEHPDLFSA
ncbi:GntR family transcriptional regulator [Microvirga sp. BT689]|uniref:GntR family transcriptional regulator n=1 Tax=Microvirga arvi TaxID=2778731 RepID=UPI00194DE58C|nr:GntR family transcriptional regulator [Microvirga arvi]MBM6580686.1 GntR family transcriptional regulator [Microvirga arvi]